MELRTKTQLAAILKSRGIRLKRNLGQNFLIDHNLLRLVVLAGELQPSDVVLEIGFGTGLLTKCLSESGAKVLAVEVDNRLAEIAREYLRGIQNVTLLVRDVLKSKHELDTEVMRWVKEAVSTAKCTSLKVVANLPYVISTPAIVCLLESDLPVKLMVLTVQREVADRLTALPGTPAYGALSVIAQTNAQLKVLRILPPSVFWPRPKVDSAIVRLTPSGEVRARIRDYECFRQVVRAAFSQRRKTLLNTLCSQLKMHTEEGAVRALLERCGIDPSLRGENLCVGEFVALGNALAGKQGK